MQTFADLGLLGLLVSLALVGAWALAVRRTLTGRRAREHAGEAAGLLTLLSVAVAFGVHSIIDWTWFIPGVAVPGLLAAGWLAGRGPLAHPVGHGPQLRRPSVAPAAAGGVLVLLAAATAVEWGICQPLRSAQASAVAGGAVASGNLAAAAADARRAADLMSVAVDPLLQLAEIDTAAGNLGAAREELLAAAARQPENPDVWLMLGEFDLRHGRSRRAVAELERALVLDRGSTEAAAALAAARAAAVR